MNLIGVPVPPGFTITTEVCTTYTQQGKEAVVKEIKGDVEKAIAHIESLTGTKFGMPRIRYWYRFVRELAFPCPV